MGLLFTKELYKWSAFQTKNPLICVQIWTQAFRNEIFYVPIEILIYFVCLAIYLMDFTFLPGSNQQRAHYT